MKTILWIRRGMQVALLIAVTLRGAGTYGQSAGEVQGSGRHTPVMGGGWNGGGSVANLSADRMARAEWIRGYHGGYELGLRYGLHDGQVLRRFLDRRPTLEPGARVTPYRAGWFNGFVAGYRNGFIFAR